MEKFLLPLGESAAEGPDFRGEDEPDFLSGAVSMSSIVAHGDLPVRSMPGWSIERKARKGDEGARPGDVAVFMYRGVLEAAEGKPVRPGMTIYLS